MKFTTLNTAAMSLTTQPSQRNRIMAAAIGFALARRLSLPSDSVTSVNAHYNLHCSTDANGIISDIHEEVCFHMDEAVRYTELFYQFRYNTAYPPVGNLSSLKYDFFCSAAGVDNYISDEDFAFLSEHRGEVLRLADLCEICIRRNDGKRPAYGFSDLLPRGLNV